MKVINTDTHFTAHVPKITFTITFAQIPLNWKLPYLSRSTSLATLFDLTYSDDNKYSSNTTPCSDNLILSYNYTQENGNGNLQILASVTGRTFPTPIPFPKFAVVYSWGVWVLDLRRRNYTWLFLYPVMLAFLTRATLRCHCNRNFSVEVTKELLKFA